MVKRQMGRSQRPGILSIKEREIISLKDNRKALFEEKKSLLAKKKKTTKDKKRIKEINQQLIKISKRFSGLVEKLHQRFLFLKKDLQIILRSNSLRSLIIRDKAHLYSLAGDGDYDKYGILTSWGELAKPHFQPYEEGSGIVYDYLSWKVHWKKIGRERKYWLSTNEKTKPTSRDITVPEFAILGINGVWYQEIHKLSPSGKHIEKTEKIGVREILREALDLEKRYPKKIEKYLISRDEVNADGIIHIKNRIKTFKSKPEVGF